MTARTPYCVAHGCRDLPPVEHLHAHLHWGCTGPEHMAELLAAYDKVRSAEALEQAGRELADKVVIAPFIPEDERARNRARLDVADELDAMAAALRSMADAATPTSKEPQR